ILDEVAPDDVLARDREAREPGRSKPDDHGPAARDRERAGVRARTRWIAWLRRRGCEAIKRRGRDERAQREEAGRERDRQRAPVARDQRTRPGHWKPRAFFARNV